MIAAVAETVGAAREAHPGEHLAHFDGHDWTYDKADGEPRGNTPSAGFLRVIDDVSK
jgi:hypothetical protein